MFSQNDSVCLPTGLKCYENEVKVRKDDCTVPCKGIYADLVINEAEDPFMDKDFKHALLRYANYKAGFNSIKGKQLFSFRIMTTFFTELEDEPNVSPSGLLVRSVTQYKGLRLV